jgi:hypothetical protein
MLIRKEDTQPVPQEGQVYFWHRYNRRYVWTGDWVDGFRCFYQDGVKGHDDRTFFYYCRGKERWVADLELMEDVGRETFIVTSPISAVSAADAGCSHPSTMEVPCGISPAAQMIRICRVCKQEC